MSAPTTSVALTDFATVKQTYLSIYALLTSYGITPIVATQAPRDSDLGRCGRI
jgi:hypothetical protein